MDVKLFLFVWVCVLAQTHVTADCPDGWTHYGSSCYFLHRGPLNWEFAKIVCETAKGHLAVIESEFENAFLSSMLKNSSVRKAWIGLEDFVMEGQFVWTISQEAPEYSNWYPGNPSDSGSGEDCGELFDSGLWNDAPCETFSNPFVCEKT